MASGDEEVEEVGEKTPCVWFLVLLLLLFVCW